MEIINIIGSDRIDSKYKYYYYYARILIFIGLYSITFMLDFVDN